MKNGIVNTGCAVSFQQDLEAAAKTALCGWLANGGNASAATWIAKGVRTPASAVAGAAAGLGLLAVNYGCNYDPNAGKPPTDQQATGCKEAATGYIELGYYDTGGGFAVPGGRQLRVIESVWKSGKSCNGGQTAWSWRAVETSGSRFDVNDLCISATAMVGRLSTGGTCKTPFTDPNAPTTLPPTQYLSPTTNCTYVVDHEAWTMRPDGTVSPVLKISAAPATARASGGVIGGCNFSPVLYVPGGPVGGGGGDGGGGTTIPWAPGPDGPGGEPWWYPLVRGAAGAVAGELVSWFLDQFRPSMADLIAERLTGGKEGTLPAVTYDLFEPCVPAGEVQKKHAVPIPKAPALAALAARADALEVFQQYQQDYRQVVCPPVRPALTGEWVTVNFLSDEASPGGEKPLRKQFRYRDQTFAPLVDHVAHWESFQWNAGPVCVISKNLSWGVPQVWAATAEEGKRVIAHAAQIAGVDLADPKHQWIVTGSADPRYGRTGRMRLDSRGGTFLRVTKRSGPNGLPVGLAPSS